MLRNTLLSFATAVGLAACGSVGAQAASWRDDAPIDGGAIQRVSSPYGYGRLGSYYEERARRGNYPDMSGYPGGNEFDPSAPWGGQAAVTARPGTDAYKIQMQRRQRYCYVFSNRC